MAKILQVQGAVNFEPRCVICLQPAQQTYLVDRTFSYGRQSFLAQVRVPMCPAHYQQAARKSPLERLTGRLGFWLGVGLGLLTAAGLFLYWMDSGQGNLFMNLLLALFLGVSFFVIVWAATAFWLAPRFADRDSLKAREAVRILRYWPGDEQMELEFINDQAADLVQVNAQEEAGE